jgi:peptide/nickel transport system substrate-binding protein
MSTSSRKLSELRAGRSEVENHYIDELLAGRLDRREFLRRGATAGMSVGVMGALLAACGNANNTSSSSSSGAGAPAAAPKKGGTLQVASQTPATALNPLIVDDGGGLAMLGQTGEFLTLDNNLLLRLQPQLATSWTHSGDGTTWTFKLRPGVKFHNGKPLTADDVVYTFKQLSDPKNASNALSTFDGVLSPAGVRKVDASTVAFHLDASNGNFPYLVSSDNYNAIIVPAGTDFATWQKTFVGTGPFKLQNYSQNVGANFVANPDYWGPKPYLDATAFKFYQSQAPQVIALQGGDVDAIAQFVPAGAEAILNNPAYTIIKLKASNHRELSMRCDQAPFTDARVRQAVALTLNRPGMVNALLHGLGSVANDNPFAPKFPSTNTSVPQRVQDISKAKQLLAAAGHPNGFSATMFADIYEEIAQLAQVIKANAAQAGINVNLKVETQTAYYGKATFGDSDWLDGQMSLVNYGDRGVPNVFLGAPLATGGAWNAAHFNNKTYDALFKQYVAAIDLQTQRTIAGKIETLLLAETPLIIPYFIDGLCATTPSVHGVNPTSISQIFLGQAYKS